MAIVTFCALSTLLTPLRTQAQNLIQNGGFESGDFTDWTQSGTTSSTLVATNLAYAHSGTYGAQLGPSGSLGFLSQTLATAPGQTYVLSFWLNCSAGAIPNEFQVAWNGTNIFDRTNYAVTGWNQLAFTNLATSASTPVQFGFRNDPSYFGFDDIIVTNNAPASISPSAYTFTTFAGYAGIGNADGIGSAAQFFNPKGITTDPAGNIYVVDSGNYDIRKVTASGVVTTIAGVPGNPGTNDGLGSAARFGHLGYGPEAIASDNAGNLYVADTGNGLIRKLSPSGTNWLVTTIAGQPQFNIYGDPVGGTNDGIGSAIRFFNPGGIVVDSATNVYVADSGNDTIRKLTQMGALWSSSTIVGTPQLEGTTDGNNNAGLLYSPYGLAMDPSGNIYVGDYTAVRRITQVAGRGGPIYLLTTLAGTIGIGAFTNAAGANARFAAIYNLAVDANSNIFVADFGNNLIRKVAPVGSTWVATSVAGRLTTGSADGTGTNAAFNSPYGIALDSSGKIYVSDIYNCEIRRVASAGVVTTLAGSVALSGANNGTGSAARFAGPYGVAVDNAGNVYVADTFNDTIRVITPVGIVSTPFGLAGSTGTNDGVGNNARFYYPFGVAVDRSGNLYVADTYNNTIRAITTAGVVSTIAGLGGTPGTNNGSGSTARFFHPGGIAVDNQTNLFVADSGNATIREITRAGSVWVTTTIAGSAGVGGTNDGAGSGARFGGLDGPMGVAVDNLGNVYVADTEGFSVRKLTQIGTNWVVSTISTNVIQPNGIGADSTGNVFTVDGDETVEKITPVGVSSVATAIGGLFGTSGSQDGAGVAALFSGPAGIAVDAAGNLYVADSGNSTIRKGVFSQYGTANLSPYAPPPMTGKLQVTLLPPEANGQWRFPWETVWHDSGFTATNLAAGNYPVEFRLVPDWLAIPPNLSTTNAVAINAGTTATITNFYYPTASPADADSAAGSLTVNLGANPPAGAGWRFLGDTNGFFASNFTTNLVPGTYLLQFAGPFSGRATPPNASVQITAGTPALIFVNYPFAAAPPAGMLLPAPVPPSQISDLTDFPFAFNGQLQTDVGFGSGVVVQSNVVLTAAHLVFDDSTLAYVSGAYWFLQEEVPNYIPSPTTARGWYVLTGYAEQRTNDLSSGTYAADVSSPQSRNLDVAALYFSSPVAEGGYGGYLPSDAVPNQWLAGTAEKMLVGYPVDGSQYGIANIVPGQMYQIGPQPYSLTLAADSVTNQQEVYTASWFLGYPGNSGGPLYVELNNYYYPAGIYLGTLNGQSVVRGIDSNVVNLITLAATLGDNGTNNSGGGVVTIIPSLTVSSFNPGYLQIQLAPPSAIQAGAAWLLQPSTTYSTATNYTQAIFSTNAVALQFRQIPGWNVPTNQSVTVVPGFISQPTAFYTVFNPMLQVNGNNLGISGTTNTTYRLEKTPSVGTIPWTAFSTNTIISPGFNLITSLGTNTGAMFYRAVWLNR